MLTFAVFRKYGAVRAIPAQERCRASVGVRASRMARTAPSTTPGDFETGPVGKDVVSMAIAYLRVHEIVTAMKVSKEQRYTALKEFKKLDEWATKYTMEQMRVVFCTNSSSGHDTIASHFKPDVLVVEEAAQSSPTDQLVPFAAWQEHLRAVVLAGDHEQLKPNVTSTRRNEASTVLDLSIMERLIEKQNEQCHELRVQYRMHPQISAWPNKQFYGGSLINAESVRGETDLQAQLVSSLGVYDKSLGSKRIFALDVSGPTVNSYRYQTGSTLINEDEAEVVAQLVKWLLESSNGAIRPSDILLITPYSGQRQYLARMLTEQLGFVGARSIACYTSAQVQGHEGQICIISMVKNSPGDATDTGFVSDARQLNVNVTRAKQQCILVGNWDAWFREIGQLAGKHHVFKHKDRLAFTELVRHLKAQHSIYNANAVLRVLVGKEDAAAVKSLVESQPNVLSGPRREPKLIKHGKGALNVRRPELSTNANTASTRTNMAVQDKGKRLTSADTSNASKSTRYTKASTAGGKGGFQHGKQAQGNASSKKKDGQERKVQRQDGQKDDGQQQMGPDQNIATSSSSSGEQHVQATDHIASASTNQVGEITMPDAQTETALSGDAPMMDVAKAVVEAVVEEAHTDTAMSDAQTVPAVANEATANNLGDEDLIDYSDDE